MGPSMKCLSIPMLACGEQRDLVCNPKGSGQEARHHEVSVKDTLFCARPCAAHKEKIATKTRSSQFT
jgi:hypothetical protein